DCPSNALLSCARRHVHTDAPPTGRIDLRAHAPIRLSISARSRVSGAAATARAMMSDTSKSMAGVAAPLLALRFLSTQRTTRTWFTLIVMPASCASLETSFGWRSGCWRMKSDLVITGFLLESRGPLSTEHQLIKEGVSHR